MQAEQWDRIKQIFETALAVPEPERAECVEKLCAGDKELRDTVLELLSNHHSPEPSANTLNRSTPGPCVLRQGDLIAGRFRITRFIASGGMGEVYEAFDERLRSRLALKTLRPELVSEEGALDRFQREILMARGVSHDSLCRVYDFIEHHPGPDSQDRRVIPCLTMELLEGESLAARLSRERPLSLSEALALLRQMAAGLDVLHEHGIIHRDLKPSNIMLARRRNGQTRAVVTDFGLAKLDDHEGDLFESYTHFRAGAPYFMSPELLRSGRPSMASDIYAFGLIIDEMVTATKAFSARSLPELYYAKLWDKPAPPGERAKGLPDHWERAILRCLDPEPERRFTRAADIITALETPDTQMAPALQPKHATPPPPAVHPHGHWKPSRRAILSTVAIAIPTASVIAIVTNQLEPVSTSIEVFDIANQTNQPELTYLCSGTTNEVLRRLMHVNRVRVIPLHATRADAPQRHASRFSLEGSLHAHQGQMVLSVQLTDNQDGSLVWSERFEKQRVANPLNVQSEIANSVVTQVEKRVLLGHGDSSDEYSFLLPVTSRLRRLLAQSAAQIGREPTRSNVALDYYMRGRQLLEEVSPESAQAAVQQFQRAIEEDPNFALAHASLAEAHIALMNYNVAPHQQLIDAAQAAAKKAIDTDPTLAEGYCALAAIRQMAWDWDVADTNYREAMRLKPMFPRARRWFAGMILQFGRFDEALDQAQRSIEEDPYDRAAPTSVGFYLLMAGRYHEAITVLERTTQGRDVPGARKNLAQAYAQLAYVSSGAARDEYFAKALAEAQKVAAMERRTTVETGEEPRPSLADEMFALIHSLRGEPQAAEPFIRNIVRDVDAGLASPVTVATMYAVQRRNAEALTALERAAQWRDRRLMYIKVFPFLANLRGEPRFQSLVQTMRL